MHHFKTLILIMTMVIGSVFGQQKSGGRMCPVGNAPLDTIFYFPSGKAIGVCGYRLIDSETKAIFFVEFDLIALGPNTIVGHGGREFQNSKLQMRKDTLFLEDWPLLPTGKNFKEMETFWRYEKLYFDKGQVYKKWSVNRDIRKYSPQEIKSVLNEYDIFKKKQTSINEKTVKFTYKLFMAALSGDAKARECFLNIPNTLSEMDTQFMELYKNLQTKLAEWDSN